MKQATFSGLAWSSKGKVTRRERFLAEMDAVIRWSRLLALIEPHYPSTGQGRPPIGLERMLRVYFLQQWFNLSDPQAEDSLYDSESMRRFMEMLDVLGLGALAGQPATSLPYGQQRRLEIARALALGPGLLLLDEPAGGMDPTEKARLMDTVRQLREEFDLTILLNDHDMKFVMGICERIYVLDHGERIAHGTPAEIRADPKVIEAYLGSES